MIFARSAGAFVAAGTIQPSSPATSASAEPISIFATFSTSNGLTSFWPFSAGARVAVPLERKKAAPPSTTAATPSRIKFLLFIC